MAPHSGECGARSVEDQSTLIGRPIRLPGEEGSGHLSPRVAVLLQREKGVVEYTRDKFVGGSVD